MTRGGNRVPDWRSALCLFALVAVAGLAFTGGATAGETTVEIENATVEIGPDGTFAGWTIRFDRSVAGPNGGPLGAGDIAIEGEGYVIDDGGSPDESPIRIRSLSGDSTVDGRITVTFDIYDYHNEEWIHFRGKETIERLSYYSSDQVRVTYSDSSEDEEPASVTLLADTHDFGSVSLPMTVSGTTGDTGVVTDPSSVDFGDVGVGETGVRAVTVSNRRDESVDLATPEIRGPGGAAYAVDETAGDTLAGGESRTVDVTFGPRETGQYDARLAFVNPADGSVEAEVPLTGTGTGPDLEVAPESLSFPGASEGETVQREVRVTNTGTASARVTDVDVVGDESFSLEDPGLFTLTPGGSTTLTVSMTAPDDATRSGLLRIRTEGAAAADTSVALSTSEANMSVRVDQSDDRTEVDVAVEDATAGEPVPVTVPSQDTESDAEVQQFSVTPARSGSFTLNLTASGDALSTSPAFETGDGTRPLAFLSFDHSIPNAEVESATVTVRARREALASRRSDADSVSLYRFEDGEWVAKPTAVRGRTDRYAVLRGTAEGLSEWTAAARRPRFNISDRSTSIDTGVVGDEVTIQVFVRNTGGADGVYVAELLLNGEVVDEREATIPEGGKRALNFERSFDEAGDYRVQVNDVFVGEVTITEGENVAVDEESDGSSTGGDATATPASAGTDEEADPDTAGTGSDGPPLIPLAIAAVVLGGAGLLYLRGSRQPPAGRGPRGSPGEGGPPGGDGPPVEKRGDAPAADHGDSPAASTSPGPGTGQASGGGQRPGDGPGADGGDGAAPGRGGGDDS
jgi:hypothetical protein